jgi:hypothetical protein
VPQGEVHGRANILIVFGEDHADWEFLVDTRVSRVEASPGFVEVHLAFYGFAQFLFKPI